MTSDKLNISNRIIAEQDKLIDSFDTWIRLVKANDLLAASEVVKESNLLRIEISKLKKELTKLNIRSGLLLKN